eukprot:1984746-Pleurochrysis_carterae.AAC.3
MSRAHHPPTSLLGTQLCVLRATGLPLLIGVCLPHRLVTFFRCRPRSSASTGLRSATLAQLTRESTRSRLSRASPGRTAPTWRSCSSKRGEHESRLSVRPSPSLLLQPLSMLVSTGRYA